MIKKLIMYSFMMLLLLPAGAWAETLFDEKAADTQFQNGLNFHYQGQYQQAIQHFEAATMINPDDPRPYYFLGYAYYQLRNMQKAQEAFEQAYQTNPDYSPQPIPAQP